MFNKKTKILCSAILSTMIISSTPVFAASITNTQNNKVNVISAGTSTITSTQNSKTNVTNTNFANSNISVKSGTINPLFTDWNTPIWTIVGRGGVLQQGDVGLSVEQLQFLLRWRGYSISRDGIFGSQTKTSVLYWQSNHKQQLTVDGIVGINTFNSLLGGYQFTWDSSVGLAEITDERMNVYYKEQI